jgi:hypothetical protein
LAFPIVVFGIHELAASQIKRTLHTGCDIGDLNVRHPLERKVSIFGAARAQADDRHAQVVHQVLAPKGVFARGEDA